MIDGSAYAVGTRNSENRQSQGRLLFMPDLGAGDNHASRFSR